MGMYNDLSSLRYRPVEQPPLRSLEGKYQVRYRCSTPRAIYYHHGKGHSSIIWQRSTDRQHPLSGYSSIAQSQIVSIAHSYHVQICINVFNFRYIYLAYSISRNQVQSASLSMQASVSFPCIVPDDSPIVLLARKNNVASIEAMFRARRASPADRLISGSTLLHVSDAPLKWNLG